MIWKQLLMTFMGGASTRLCSIKLGQRTSHFWQGTPTCAGIRMLIGVLYRILLAKPNKINIDSSHKVKSI
jgi:UDP-N-acetylmuramyl pentapeptide phosphotransferase/UDP-N-acetylglucosamine-1-phosphate transferase